MNKNELEERLIDFSVLIIGITDEMPDKKAANHLSGQLIRSGSSPALNYGEAIGAESIRDFLHKIKIVLKELRETLTCLKIISRANLYSNTEKMDQALKENNELISIFVSSTKTAQRRLDGLRKRD